MNLIRVFSQSAYAGTHGLVFGPPYYLSLFEASLSLAVKLPLESSLFLSNSALDILNKCAQINLTDLSVDFFITAPYHKQ